MQEKRYWQIDNLPFPRDAMLSGKAIGLPLVDGFVLMYLCNSSFHFKASSSGTTPRITATPCLCRRSLNVVLLLMSPMSLYSISGMTPEPVSFTSAISCLRVDNSARQLS